MNLYYFLRRDLTIALRVKSWDTRHMGTYHSTSWTKVKHGPALSNTAQHHTSSMGRPSSTMMDQSCYRFCRTLLESLSSDFSRKSLILDLQHQCSSALFGLPYIPNVVALRRRHDWICTLNAPPNANKSTNKTGNSGSNRTIECSQQSYPMIQILVLTFK